MGRQDPNFDPRAEARAELKARKLKNEAQRLRNIASTSSKSAAASAKAPKTDGPPDRAVKRAKLSRDLLTTRTSTASLGRHDRTLDGETQVIGRRRGDKRRFEPTEVEAEAERSRGLDILHQLDHLPRPTPSASGRHLGSKNHRTAVVGDEGLVNTRKAIRSISKGRGSAALAGGASRRGRGMATRGGSGRGGRGGRGRH